MKNLLLGCLVLRSVIVVEGTNDDGILDIGNEIASLHHDASLWFKLEVFNGITYHPDYDNQNLEFINVGNTVINNYQYFNVQCKKDCKEGDEYDLFLTENLAGSQYTGVPPNTYAFIVQII